MFRKFVDEAEIDEWFEEEKKKLQKKYYQEHYKGKGGKESFEKAMKKLLARYDRENSRFVRREERKERLQKPIIELKLFYKKIRKNIKNKVAFMKESRKKRRFDKEYERLMKK